jgi:hypothetical protein
MSTMHRKEVEQWALAVIKVRDTLSPDRLVRRGEVAEMCGVHPTGADRIMRWADMMEARGEALPDITDDQVFSAVGARIGKHRGGAVFRPARVASPSRAVTAWAPLPDYRRPISSANIGEPRASVPPVVDIPPPHDDGAKVLARHGFRLMMEAMSACRYKPKPVEKLVADSGVPAVRIRAAAIRGLVVIDDSDTVHATAYGLLFHAAHIGPDRWALPGEAIVAMQRAVRHIGPSCRKMKSTVVPRAWRHVSRYTRVLSQSGMIRVFHDTVYLTRHGHRFAQMDLTIQG